MINNIEELKKVGEKTKKYYEKLGIFTPNDLLYFYPRDYEVINDITNIIDLNANDIYLIKAKLVDKPKIIYNNRLKMVIANLKDSTGIIKAIWFNSPFILNVLKDNEDYIFRGKISYYKKYKTIIQPKIWDLNKYELEKNSINPVYNLTKGINNELIKSNVREVLDSINIDNNIEYLDKDYLNDNNMIDIYNAYKSIHFPKDFDDLIKAHNRLAFQEFLIYSLSIIINKNSRINGRSDFKDLNFDEIIDIINLLPYKLTKDQISCINDIVNDFNECKKMNRLIEGDVGSGKSIIVFLIAILLSKKKVQTVIMAPTEVLAMQHYNNLLKIINDSKLNINVCLLTSSLDNKNRKNILDKIKNNYINIIIGTHACYSKDVIYYDLALIVIDEQHRFGVKQRK